MPRSKRHPKRRKKIAGRSAGHDQAVLDFRPGVPSVNMHRCWACKEVMVKREDHPDLQVCNSCVLKYKFSCDDCGEDVINVGGETVHLGEERHHE